MGENTTAELSAMDSGCPHLQAERLARVGGLVVVEDAGAPELVPEGRLRHSDQPLGPGRSPKKSASN